jgi:hypothetical protein
MIRRLPKFYEFTARNRKLLTFSDKDKVRLNDDNKVDPHLSLKGEGSYSTDNDINVLTWAMNPQGLKQWLAFEAEEETPAGTSVGYRLVMGGDEYFWNGSAWTTGTGNDDYCSALDFNANIQSLTLTSREFKVRIKLKTTDANATPTIKRLKFAGNIFVSWWDDLIYDTIIKELLNSFRAVTAIEVAAVSATSTIDLGGTYKLDNSGYNLTGVVAAYNLTTDPEAFNNIAQSYTPGAQRPDGAFEDGSITLSQSVNEGDIVRLEMQYTPEVAVFTNQDYYEVERFPMLVFENIRTVRLKDGTDQEMGSFPSDAVKNFSDNTAIQMFKPRQSTVRFDFAIHAKGYDLARLSDAMDSWLESHRTLKSHALDETINVDSVDEIAVGNSINLDDKATSTGSFQLRGVPFHIKPAEDKYLVERVNASYERRS